MGFLFLGLTFLAGITVGTIEYAMINVVVFLALALLVVKFVEPRFGTNGLVYGMAGAFFASFLWPHAMIAFADDCEGDECLAPEGEVTVVLMPV
ncbi:hypothetical protein [Erythrobacter sp. JK5]|uniref:hypothetical protein n=1 Tax=Erythrobacter sp. JK5 TaxID=2829500 RepID=UPI001BA43E53|nr:hypothetical protein [Erythrobacter sp. JK5]QUL37925.1 hypothetical protein KDC96_00355 [Erythrobacter sp. JK5]